MKRFFTLVFILSLLYFSFNPLSKTFAAEQNPGPAGVPLMEYMVARVICTTVPLGYIVLMVVLIIAGFKYIVSGGEAKAVSSAHQTVTWGLLGILFLAIAWLILLLIQNFTGIEVTKFSVSSLPGIQGFSGSCWGEPPVAPEPPKPAVNTRAGNQPATSTCNGWFIPANSTAELIPDLGATNRAYTNMDDLKELANVLDQPRSVTLLIGTVDNVIYHITEAGLFALRAQQGTRGFTYLPDNGFFGKFERDSSGAIANTFVEANLRARDVANEILARHGGNPIPMGEIYRNLFASTVSCSDYDYIGISVMSPLIYLYPTGPKWVSVKIKSLIISPKLPLVNSSWNVVALPDGTLITLDGKKYPYIPYEFLRSDFKRPDKGIVVEGSRLEEYLKKDLWKKLGLKETEIADYWIDTKPRVPKANYYFVSLIERSEINRVLPMEINPSPDTIIRNMTYILPLSKPFIPQPLEEDRLKSPERYGFSVLENGVFVDGT